MTDQPENHVFEVGEVGLDRDGRPWLITEIHVRKGYSKYQKAKIVPLFEWTRTHFVTNVAEFEHAELTDAQADFAEEMLLTLQRHEHALGRLQRRHKKERQKMTERATEVFG